MEYKTGLPDLSIVKTRLSAQREKRLPNRHPQPLVIPHKMNHCWSVDVMSDALSDGRRFRLFNVVDDFNREAPANIPAHRVVRILERLSAERGEDQYGVKRIIFIRKRIY